MFKTATKSELDVKKTSKAIIKAIGTMEECNKFFWPKKSDKATESQKQQTLTDFSSNVKLYIKFIDPDGNLREKKDLDDVGTYKTNLINCLEQIDKLVARVFAKRDTYLEPERTGAKKGLIAQYMELANKAIMNNKESMRSPHKSTKDNRTHLTNVIETGKALNIVLDTIDKNQNLPKQKETDTKDEHQIKHIKVVEPVSEKIYNVRCEAFLAVIQQSIIPKLKKHDAKIKIIADALEQIKKELGLTGAIDKESKILGNDKLTTIITRILDRETGLGKALFEIKITSALHHLRYGPQYVVDKVDKEYKALLDLYRLDDPELYDPQEATVCSETLQEAIDSTLLEFPLPQKTGGSQTHSSAGGSKVIGSKSSMKAAENPLTASQVVEDDLHDSNPSSLHSVMEQLHFATTSARTGTSSAASSRSTSPITSRPASPSSATIITATSDAPESEEAKQKSAQDEKTYNAYITVFNRLKEKFAQGTTMRVEFETLLNNFYKKYNLPKDENAESKLSGTEKLATLISGIIIEATNGRRSDVAYEFERGLEKSNTREKRLGWALYTPLKIPLSGASGMEYILSRVNDDSNALQKDLKANNLLPKDHLKLHSSTNSGPGSRSTSPAADRLASFLSLSLGAPATDNRSTSPSRARPPAPSSAPSAPGSSSPSPTFK